MIAQDAARDVMGLGRMLLHCDSQSSLSSVGQGIAKRIRKIGDAALRLVPASPAVRACWRADKWRVVEDWLGGVALLSLFFALWLLLC